MYTDYRQIQTTICNILVRWLGGVDRAASLWSLAQVQSSVRKDIQMTGHQPIYHRQINDELFAPHSPVSNLLPHGENKVKFSCLTSES